MTNRVKGLDLTDRVPEELRMWFVTLYRTRRSNHPQAKEMQKGKWLSEEALQIAEKRREVKRQRRKGKIYPSECRIPKNAKER